MKRAVIPLFVATLIYFVGCNPSDEDISRNPNLNLTFSTDTLLFDTLITSRTSITKRLRIFNPNQQAVEISDIRLAQGNSYNIIANGKQGPSVRDEVLFGGDSLLILVESRIDPMDAQLPYLVKDSIIVSWNNRQQDVKLIAWGQDAHFIPKGILCNETWTAGKPYVIMDTLLVEASCLLTIDPSATILFDNGAALFIAGRMEALGTSDSIITFRNTRFDFNYQQAPGQWDAIYFLEGSTGNELDFCLIENGRTGLRVGTPDEDELPDVRVNHTTIRHMSQSGIQAFTSDLEVTNTLIYNVGSTVIFNVAGGTYSYNHCTLVNTPSFFFGDDPIVQVADNLILDDENVLVSPLHFNFTNSIIWGSGETELLLSAGFAENTIEISDNIIRSKDDIVNNWTSVEEGFPGFVSTFNFDYRPDSLSFARDRGTPTLINDDITGIPRDSLPDIGAFEFLPGN